MNKCSGWPLVLEFLKTPWKSARVIQVLESTWKSGFAGEVPWKVLGYRKSARRSLQSPWIFDSACVKPQIIDNLSLISSWKLLEKWQKRYNLQVLENGLLKSVATLCLRLNIIISFSNVLHSAFRVTWTLGDRETFLRKFDLPNVHTMKSLSQLIGNLLSRKTYYYHNWE